MQPLREVVAGSPVRGSGWIPGTPMQPLRGTGGRLRRLGEVARYGSLRCNHSGVVVAGTPGLRADRLEPRPASPALRGTGYWFASSTRWPGAGRSGTPLPLLGEVVVGPPVRGGGGNGAPCGVATSGIWWAGSPVRGSGWIRTLRCRHNGEVVAGSPVRGSGWIRRTPMPPQRGSGGPVRQLGEMAGSRGHLVAATSGTWWPGSAVRGKWPAMEGLGFGVDAFQGHPGMGWP